MSSGFLNPRAALGNKGGAPGTVFLHTMRITVPILLLLVLRAPAQSTWIVDASGAADADFASIQAAVDAATDGDRILIRAGQYGGFEIVGKGLAVHGEGGVRLSSTGTLHVRDTGPDQHVSISDLRISGVSIGSGQGTTNCRGRVLLERLSFDPLSSRPTFRSSDDVRMRFCDFQMPVEVRGSTLTASDCHLNAGFLYPIGQPALLLVDSTAVLARTDVTGSTGFATGGAQPAIRMDADSTLRLTGDGGDPIQASPGTTLPAHAIDGAGRLERDPRLSIQARGGASRIAPAIDDTVRDIPDLQVLGDSEAGRAVSVTLSGREGEIWGLMVALPNRPFELPGIGGAFAYTSPLIALQGVFGPAPVRLSYTAIDGLPPGFQLCWQGAASEPGGTWQHTNAETYARRR